MMKKQQFENVKLGLFISLIVILFGFSLGGIFGLYEDSIKESLNKKASSVLETVYQNNEDTLDHIVDKSWEYMKLSHTHAMGLGPIALVLIILLSFMEARPVLKYLTSMMLALGALGYSLFWMLAAFKAPITGNTEITKESLSYIAKPSAGLCLIGIIILIMIVLSKFLKKPSR